ncbi:PQQ-binding-like beta-propeller repeat protein [Actinoplanes sp. NPDC024001]|uniref:outer membrane protein assembly factor BamB family protein n=1 Tax=Actinoplanes sp. NPDC024001 TaxID=3154598 RepID=UPI0033E92B10
MPRSVIELGDVSDRSAGPHPDDALPRLDRRLVRRLGAAAVALVCAVAFGGSAAPGPPTVHEAWSLPVGEPQAAIIAGGATFVHRMAGGRAELAAYDLATGAPRWTWPAGPELGILEALPGAGILLLRTGQLSVEQPFPDGSTGTLIFHRETTALDPATGDRLWTRPGEPLPGTTGEVLLEQRDEQGAVRSLSLVTARDGKQIWRRPATGVQTATVGLRDGRPHAIVTATAAGVISVLAYADGRPVRSRSLRWQATRPSSGYDTWLRVVGDRLFVMLTEPRGSTVTAYRLDTLQQLWQKPADRYPDVHDCGALLCQTDDEILSGVDPATGERRWELPGIAFVLWSGDGRVLAGDGRDPPHYQLVDAADGRRIGPGGVGQAYPEPGAGSVLLLRPFAGAGGRTAVSRLDLRTGRVVLLGSIPPHHEFGCDAAEGHLLCRSTDRMVVSTTG